MFSKKVPIYSIYLSILITLAFSYAIFSTHYKKEVTIALEESSEANSACNYKLARLKGYDYISPLLYAEPKCESANLADVKSEIESMILSEKASANITSASVFLRKFSNGEWTSINDDEKYSPGSLLKVPELITFIKMNEAHPGLLDKKIVFEKEFNANKKATYLSKSIKVGNAYTIRELLHYMVSYSDNNATILLNQNIDVATFQKLFTDLGLSKPDFNATQFLITSREYSQFMKALYNSSYLSNKESEYCAELLGESDFKEGMVAGIPADTKIAHKFGEGGYESAPNFSESGIIYCNNQVYLLTVMTKGTDMKKLPKVVSNISRLVYQYMSEKY